MGPTVCHQAYPKPRRPATAGRRPGRAPPIGTPGQSRSPSVARPSRQQTAGKLGRYAGAFPPRLLFALRYAPPSPTQEGGISVAPGASAPGARQPGVSARAQRQSP